MTSHQLRVLLMIHSPSTFQNLLLDISMMLIWRLVSNSIRPTSSVLTSGLLTQFVQLIMIVGRSGSFIKGRKYGSIQLNLFPRLCSRHP